MKAFIRKLPTKKDLQKEVQRLEKDKEEKDKELQRLKEKSLFRQGDAYLCGMRKHLLRKMPIGFLDTVFRTRREELAACVNASFEPAVIRHVVSQLSQQEDSQTFAMAFLCTGILPKKEGPILLLTEPYRTISTQPLKLSLTEAEQYLDQLVIAQVVLDGHAEKQEQFKIRALRKTIYGRDTERKNGTESGIYPESALIRYMDLKDAQGRDCMDKLMHLNAEISRIGSRTDSYCYLESPDTLYIRRRGIREVLFVDRGRIEYYYQEVGNHAEDVGQLNSMEKGGHLKQVVPGLIGPMLYFQFESDLMMKSILAHDP